MTVLLSEQNKHTLTEKDFQRISKIIYDHCGIHLHEGKKTLVRARLAKRIRTGGFESFTSYIEYALSKEGCDEFYNLVDSISTNLTSFFRESKHFDYLRKAFLPKLVAEQAKMSNRKIRVWSAGCSTGEEPYSIAITLQEELEKHSNWNIKILASDVSTRVLDHARAGIYDAERVAPLTRAQKQRFLEKVVQDGQKCSKVADSLKKMIKFRYLNLMEPWPFKGLFDVIFCRNVMIYFDKPTQEKLVNRYYNYLTKGGLLFIGHSESLTSINHKYRYVEPATYAKP